MGKAKGEPKSIGGEIEKVKKRMWKTCGCGTGWFIFGVVCFVVGIALMVKFGEFWGDEANPHWSNLAYTGAAFLCVGFLLTAIGILCCVTLCVVYKRTIGKDPTLSVFKPPAYAYGTAPYPQQPPWNPNAPPPNAANPSAPPADQNDVKVDVSEHHKF